MNRTFVLVVLALVLGSAFADAQVIRPRGAAPKAEAAVADAGTAPAVAAVANSPAERPVVAVAAPLVPDARDVKIAELRQELRTIIHENPAHAGTIAELKQVRDTAIAEASGKYALMTMTVISAVLFLLGISIGWILRGRKAPKSGDGEPVTFDSPRRMTTVAPERTPVDETRLTKAVDKALHPPMTTVVVLGLALGLASVAQAQPATKVVATPAVCSIRAINVGAVLVKEQDAAAISIAVKNCGEIKSLSVMADATTPSSEIVFTEVALKGNVVTAKVVATANALTGPTSLQLVLADGTEVVSPEAIYLLVLDSATAQVRKDLRAETMKVAAATTVVAKDLTALRAVVATKADKTEVTTKATKAEVDAAVAAAIAPLQAKLAALEAASNANTSNIGVLAGATLALAEGQAVLGNTEVKKGGFLGFGGKKPLDPEVAASAERIRQMLAPAAKK